LGFGHLVAVQRLGDGGDLGAEFADLLAHLGQRVDALMTFACQLVTTAGRDGHRRLQSLREMATRLGDCGGDRRGVRTGLACALRP
jgi:hypothetical protein